MRRYRVRLGTVEQAARYAEKWFVPLIRKLPGFVTYYLMDAGNDTLASIGLFETREGAESAARLARDWFEDEWPSFRPLPPEVVVGEIVAQTAVDDRPLVDRRKHPDRRVAALLEGAESWRGTERRNSSERRARSERQSNFAAQLELRAAG
jgi:hypothetical protein